MKVWAAERSDLERHILCQPCQPMDERLKKFLQTSGLADIIDAKID
jgi:hypothetical protein